jgi:TPR repeat protein
MIWSIGRDEYEPCVQATAAALILAVGFAGPLAADPLEDGVNAAARGDYVTAIQLWRSLADQGDARAQFNLGNMYRNGQGVRQDYAAAVSWYRKAPDQGYIPAQFNLGTMYLDGHGAPQDYAAAASWYRKAANQGNAFAQFNLGVMYLNGHGVAQDYVTAHMWFNLAAARGDKDAAKNRDIVTAKMTPAQIAVAQKLAREWKPK